MVNCGPTNESIKLELRQLIKQEGWDDCDIGALARDFIVDTHQTREFLNYLKQLISDTL